MGEKGVENLNGVGKRRGREKREAREGGPPISCSTGEMTRGTVLVRVSIAMMTP